METSTKEMDVDEVRAEEEPKGKEDGGASSGGSEEYRKYDALARKDETDFDNWVIFLQYAEMEADYTLGSVAFERFLSLFPLCYGYWQKFAAYASARGKDEAALRDIYERAVRAIPISVDIWMKYIAFAEKANASADEQTSIKSLRELYERAVAACGTDTAAQSLWNAYLGFEQKSEDGEKNVCALYYRIVTQRWQGGEQYWQLYLQILQQCSLRSIAKDDEEIDQITSEILNAARGADKTGDATDARPSDAEIRAKIVERRKAEYAVVAKDAYERVGFEQAIKRAYYHVKPLDQAEVDNWKAYLKFEESKSGQTDPERVRQLYERCLVPCANMPSFWVMYVRFLARRSRDLRADSEDSVASVKEIEAVYDRACGVFVRYHPEMYLERATWYERRDLTAETEKIFRYVLSDLTPGLLDAIFQFANFLRRQGRVDEAAALYKEHANKSSDSATKAFLSVQHANFLRWHGRSDESVRAAFEMATQAMPSDKHLWMMYIRFELSRASAETPNSAVASLFERALSDENTTLSVKDKTSLWHWQISLEEDCGHSVGDLQDMRARYERWKDTGCGSKKRPLPNGTASETIAMNGADAKKARVDMSSATPQQAPYWQQQTNAAYGTNMLYGQQPPQQPPYSAYAYGGYYNAAGGQ